MDMGSSANGGGGGVLSQIPPGFRFHPTEEELLHYYLKKKVTHEMIHLDVIPAIDLNKLEPWDIQEKCRIGSSSHQNEWYFFCHKDKKYPTGSRTNRATAAGFWKATGRDKEIYSNSSSNSFFKRIGMRKTLVFYKGRAPRGQISDWIIHEYRLDDNGDNYKDEWVICRLFKKKNQHQSHYNSSKINSTTLMSQRFNNSSNDEMVRTRNRENDFERLNYYRACTSRCESRPIDAHHEEITDSDHSSIVTINQEDVNGGCSTTALERFFDFLLDGHEEDDTSKQVIWFTDDFRENNEMGLWDLIEPSSSSADPQCHVSSFSNL